MWKRKGDCKGKEAQQMNERSKGICSNRSNSFGYACTPSAIHACKHHKFKCLTLRRLTCVQASQVVVYCLVECGIHIVDAPSGNLSPGPPPLPSSPSPHRPHQSCRSGLLPRHLPARLLPAMHAWLRRISRDGGQPEGAQVPGHKVQGAIGVR